MTVYSRKMNKVCAKSQVCEGEDMAMLDNAKIINKKNRRGGGGLGGWKDKEEEE